VDQQIVITMPDGRRIVLTLVEIRDTKARIGIAAPDDVIVHRSEVQSVVDRDGPSKRPRNRDGGPHR
jgi:sRNA-binding carbon storage regulator CsrA